MFPTFPAGTRSLEGIGYLSEIIWVPNCNEDVFFFPVGKPISKNLVIAFSLKTSPGGHATYGIFWGTLLMPDPLEIRP